MQRYSAVRHSHQPHSSGLGASHRRGLPAVALILMSAENATVIPAWLHARAVLSQHWLPDEELQRVLDQYDTNKDGVISFEEFKQIVGVLPQAACCDTVPDSTRLAVQHVMMHPGVCVRCRPLPAPSVCSPQMIRRFLQVYDGILLEGTLAEYEGAFKAVDKSGNGTIGETGSTRGPSAAGSRDVVVRIPMAWGTGFGAKGGGWRVGGGGEGWAGAGERGGWGLHWQHAVCSALNSFPCCTWPGPAVRVLPAWHPAHATLNLHAATWGLALPQAPRSWASCLRSWATP